MHKILSSTEENIILAKEKINSDELVAFPTETVYGLGGNAYSDIAVSKIFEFKNRPKFNPLPICYPNLERASNDVYITETAQKLAKVFMPGPLTPGIEWTRYSVCTDSISSCSSETFSIVRLSACGSECK